MNSVSRIVAAAAAMTLTLTSCSNSNQLADRQTAVAAAGAEVMPFDLDAIHGEAMPGLAALKDRYDEIDVQLLVGNIGATLTYTTSEPELVQAIHDWFEAQTSDHGGHAEHTS